MWTAHSSSMQLLRRLDAIVTRWRRLVSIARNPYRPELHYMRGPGPKWHAKYLARGESAGALRRGPTTAF